MKKFKKILTAILTGSITASTLMPAVLAETADSSGHTTYYNEALLGNQIYYDQNRDITREEYYAYNSYGEPLFVVTEYYNSDGEVSTTYISMFYLYDEEGYSIVQEIPHLTREGGNYVLLHYAADGKISYTEQYSVGSCTVIGYSAEYEMSGGGRDERTYSEDGLLATATSGQQYVLDENGNVLQTYLPAEDGTLYLNAEFQYNEHNDVTESIYYASDGTISSQAETSYEYNEYGKPSSSSSSTGSSTACFYSYWDPAIVDASIASFGNDYSGYWTREEDGITYFLSFSINAIWCSGYLNPDTGIPIVENFAFCDNWNGGSVISADIYETWLCEHPYEQDEISISYQDSHLIFDGKEYTRSY
jgi:hypothetical protein